jgi:hypothetical protein
MKAEAEKNESKLKAVAANTTLKSFIHRRARNGQRQA